MLLGERDERRMGELLAKTLLKPVVWACPTWVTCPADTVAKVRTRPPSARLTD